MKSHLLVLASLLAVTGIATACSESPVSGGTDEANLTNTNVNPDLEAAALAKLTLIEKELDANYLKVYGLEGSLAQQFIQAVKLEYGDKPELLKRRLETLASAVLFAAPDKTTDPKVGRITPFHGMTETHYANLETNEDFVFNSHMHANSGSSNGVRPFSVCETKYMIGLSKGEITGDFAANSVIKNYDGYAKAYGDFAASCEQRDLDEWYNFRGLGGLRPSWLESNYSDRVLKRMIKSCKAPSAEWKSACDEFNKDRLAFRDKENTGMYLRQMMYDLRPEAKIQGQSDEAYFRHSSNSGAFVRDRDGDGISEWIAPGPLTLVPGASWKMDSGVTVTVSEDGKKLVGDDGKTLEIASATLAINNTGTFSGDLTGTFNLADGTKVISKVTPRAVQAISRTDTRWNKDFLGRKDVGLTTVFSDPGGCSGDAVKPDSCPLLGRFYSMIDRHEDFYQTYSALDPDFTGISSQPSPLVACSITLSAADQWSSAGTPAGGVAGFIYLMRIPFHAILSADARSVDTLGRLKGGTNNGLNAGPKVATLQEIYSASPAERESLLDMSKLWVDIATLSSNAFASEHEISKVGSVPAEQIEGLLVVRRPAAMAAAAPPHASTQSAPAPVAEGAAVQLKRAGCTTNAECPAPQTCSAGSCSVE